MNVNVNSLKSSFAQETGIDESEQKKFIFDYYLKMGLITVDGDFLYEKPLWQD
jgi:hypothetical protein